MRARRLALTAAVTLIAASPIVAQEHAHPAGAGPDMVAMHCGGGTGGMMHDMHGDSMMRGMMVHMMGAPTPGMILHHQQQLVLNPGQVNRLEALQKQAQAECTEHMRAGMTEFQAANQLLEAPTPDMTAYAAKVKSASAHMAEGHIAMAKAAVEARTVLTPMQRKTLTDLMAQMHKGPGQ